MSNILLTGAATPSGGFLAAKLRDNGDAVYTVGKGDTFNADFRYLDGNMAIAAVHQCERTIGKPDVIIHNARLSDPGNLNHILYANVNARILLDRHSLNVHRAESTPFRSIHILGWGPEWADARDEIFVSLAAQRAIPAALVARVNPLEVAAAEAEHKAFLAKREHDKNEERRKKIHDEAEERNAKWHEARGEKYKKTEYQPEPFRDTMESVWVPDVDAVLLSPHPDDAANGLITRESLFKSVLEALELPHEAGKLTTLIVSKE